MNKNKWFLNGGRGSGQTYRRLFEYYENKVAELEKENAELKIARDNCEEQFQDKVGELAIEVDRVIRVKEIIREFVEWANWQGNSKCPSFKSIQDKAEQFLSEVEK